MNKLDIQAVLFDMDGLMFDTERLAAEAWRQLGNELGFDLDSQKLAQLRGRSVNDGRDMFRQWFGNKVDYDEAREKRQHYVNQKLRSEGLPLKPGLIELLAFLDENGYRKAMATSTIKKTAEGYLEMAGLTGYFDEIVFGDEVKKCKPRPDIFLGAAEKLKVSPLNCLVLEDSYQGIAAGSAAGCSVIMVPDQDEPTQEIRNVCTKICDSLLDVIKFLINNKIQS